MPWAFRSRGTLGLGPPLQPQLLHSWLLPFGFNNTERFDPEMAALSAFVPTVLSARKAEFTASPVISLALTHLLRLSSAIPSSRRFRRLVEGPRLGSQNPLRFHHVRAPAWVCCHCLHVCVLHEVVTDSLAFPMSTKEVL